MYGKKNTLQIAQMLVEGVTDPNFRNSFGTIVNEYMTREQSKIIQEKINFLRNEFAKIGKFKTSPITFNELLSFFKERNVNK